MNKPTRADYMFDDEDKTLPIWKVNHENRLYRESRHPFYKHTNYVRAATREEAKAKIANFFSNHDKIRASKV